ncbi:MAG TPA: 3-hydroxyacyl-CoA dehydrogenase family protein [Roseiflexaceae bacterium]|nr:3-hydroxyacyl-CoA dehydrogenase family protein [Roseiflexaceae bacterium]
MLKTLAPGALAWPRSAAIIGAGTMGLGVAESWVAAGLAVKLVDVSPEQTRLARSRLDQRMRAHAEAGLIDPEVIARVGSLPAVDDIESAVDDVDLVFEAVFEQIDVKQRVLAAIEARARPAALIASNTSSLPIDDLAAPLQHPDRFMGMHWFNPPEWTPGIELIPARATDPSAVERAKSFLQAIGKRPIVVGSGPGFVANRIQLALFREALACVEDGLATPEQVDEVVRSCFGFRLPFYGPFQIADMAGLDVYRHVFGILERGLGERFQLPAALAARVEAGEYGTKTGAGFFSYTAEQRERLLIERDRHYAMLSELLEQIP